MVDRGDGKKSDTYGPPGSQHHVNQGQTQQQQLFVTNYLLNYD